MPKLKESPAASTAPADKKAKAPKKVKIKKVEQPAATREVLYPRYDVRVFTRDADRAPLDADGKPIVIPMDWNIAKELLGWEEETETKQFKDNYLLIDKNGVKVRCTNNLANRPYYPQLAEDWMLEVLRQKWQMNGETVIIDMYGGVHDGQHRLIGLIFAVQEWLKDSKRKKIEQKWHGYWPTEPCIDTTVFLGISSTDEVVNTIGTGKPRSLTDVLFRSRWYQSKSTKERIESAKVLNTAIKLLWYRTSQQYASNAPRRPHSESLQFLENHERLLECVSFIQDESAGKDGGIAMFLPLGYAAGLMYLMGSATSEAESYVASNSESALKWDLWDKAQEFWVDFSANGTKTEALREAMIKIPPEAGGKYGTDLRCGMVIKAWNQFSDGVKLTIDNVQVDTTTNDHGQPILAEIPRIGGIDVEYENDRQEADEPADEAVVTPDTSGVAPGECLKGGEHEWLTEKNSSGTLETFCKKCLEPKTTKRKGK